jgi:hypothetical protein
MPLAALTAVVIVAALMSGPRGGDAGPTGTLALRRLLGSFGRTVTDGDAPPASPGTFVLLYDLRDEEQDGRILEWVRSGGRLVLADPDSLVLVTLGIGFDEEVPKGRLVPGCFAPEVRGVRSIETRAQLGLVSDDEDDAACFRKGAGAFLVARDVGNGRVVVLADRSPFTNEMLRRGDAAVLALQAIPKGPVVFGSPRPTGAGAPSRGIWESLPVAAKAAIIQLGLALVAFAIVRARRLGRPVLEEPIAPIPAGELPRATARLYRSARASGFAGRELRRAMIGRLGRRVGVPGASAEELAAVLAGTRVGDERELVKVFAGAEPADDAGLIELARRIEDVRRRVEGGEP